MTDVQLHRYNASTVDQVRQDLDQWATLMSTPEHPVESYFIEVSFEGVPQPQLKLSLNKIPTSFDLTDEQVDTLISSGRSILKNNPDFQRLIMGLQQP
jgi:NTE family protein